MADGAEQRPAFGGVHHTAVTVTDIDALHAWAAWLDAQSVAHGGVVDSEVPFPYSVVIFRDPDNTQLELCCLRT